MHRILRSASARLVLSLLFTSTWLLVVAVASFAQEGGEGGPQEKGGAPPCVDEAVDGLVRHEGLFDLYPDPAQGKVWMELPAPGRDGVVAQVIYLEGLVTGLGSNPVGLDRGQMGDSRLLEIRRVGDRVVFVEVNVRYVADTDNRLERRATRQSFAESVLWGQKIGGLDEDGRSVVDLTSFLVRDAHGVTRTLKQTEQGDYQVDPERSYVDFARIFAFPDNLAFESVVTWAGPGNQPPADHVASTAPNPDAITLVQHQAFVRLPDEDYSPRAADPRMGFWSLGQADYAAPLDASIHRRWIGRHRLTKTDPAAERSTVVEPIVYYVDPGAPEPIRSALVEGASWWAEAFEAAGFVDAYRVEILPEDAHPLDVRYNVIQWVHRSTRGWSYGTGLVDPRTGEILKGHVSLGSLRVRQDRLLFEGLLGTEATGTGRADDPIEIALARIRQLSAHEVGHTLGLTHNFAASTYGDRASVMDYPAPLLSLDAEGNIDTSRAYGVGVGAWDIHTIRWGYGQPAAGQGESALLADLVREGLDAGYLFLTDADARPAGAADPRANLWDNGADAVAALETSLAVRAAALARFGEGNVPEGTPLARLEEVLAPLYFHHRYQLDAAVKTIGGLEFHYAVRGDGQRPTRIVGGARQRRAVDVVLSILDPRALDLPDEVLDLLAPRPFGLSRNREMFGNQTSPAFDALGAAATAADMVVRGVLQPERLGRVEDFSRRADDLPTVDWILGRLVDQAIPADAGVAAAGGRSAAIQRQVEEVTVRALMDLAADAAVRASLRAAAWSALDTAAARLEGRSGAQGGWLASEIRRFGERPWLAPADEEGAAPPPPGSPIGADHADCGFDPAVR